MRIERELMRGAGPVAVLKLLERAPMYGYELVEALSAKSGGILDMGQSTLYPMLYNLEAKGEIEGFTQQAPATGKERKYYRITPAGLKRLEEESLQWNNIAAAMAALGVVKLGLLPELARSITGRSGGAT